MGGNGKWYDFLVHFLIFLYIKSNIVVIKTKVPVASKAGHAGDFK
jgi:hypothetical protein